MLKRNFGDNFKSWMGDQIHWIMQELMDSSRIGTNPSPMAHYHWVPLKVVPMQVPTQNWQLIYTHYYVWAETTLHHLYLWNALPVQFLVLKTLVRPREGWKLWCDDLKNRAFKQAHSIFIIDIIIRNKTLWTSPLLLILIFNVIWSWSKLSSRFLNWYYLYTI